MTTEPRTPAPAPGRRSRWWLWVVVAFLTQFAVWTAWLVFAAHHRVEEVPLATAPAKGK